MKPIHEQDGPDDLEDNYDFGEISVAHWEYDPNLVVPLILTNALIKSPQSFVLPQRVKLTLAAMPLSRTQAADFARWVASDMDGRAAMLTEFPRIRPIFEEIVKNPDSYTRLHYYSEVTYHFLAEDGTCWYMRYRILNADKSADTGAVPPETVCLPEDTIPRPPGDTRSQTYLRDDFHARVAAGNGVYYVLQMQLRPVSVLAADNETARDCTLPWDEADCPFRDVAIIHLREPLAHDVVEPLAFSPYHAPPQLGLILARHAGETASINHLRSVVYDVSAAMRNGTPLPPALAPLFNARTPTFRLMPYLILPNPNPRTPTFA